MNPSAGARAYRRDWVTFAASFDQVDADDVAAWLDAQGGGARAMNEFRAAEREQAYIAREEGPSDD